MALAKPETSCGGNTFTYVVPRDALADAKKELQRIAGKNPVIFMESPRDDGTVQLMVLAARLTSSQNEALGRLQEDHSSFNRFEAVNFEHVVSFGEAQPRKP